jgi:hypothetical protein
MLMKDLEESELLDKEELAAAPRLGELLAEQISILQNSRDPDQLQEIDKLMKHNEEIFSRVIEKLCWALVENTVLHETAHLKQDRGERKTQTGEDKAALIEFTKGYLPRWQLIETLADFQRANKMKWPLGQPLFGTGMLFNIANKLGISEAELDTPEGRKQFIDALTDYNPRAPAENKTQRTPSFARRVASFIPFLIGTILLMVYLSHPNKAEAGTQIPLAVAQQQMPLIIESLSLNVGGKFQPTAVQPLTNIRELAAPSTVRKKVEQYEWVTTQAEAEAAIENQTGGRLILVVAGENAGTVEKDIRKSHTLALATGKLLVVNHTQFHNVWQLIEATHVADELLDAHARRFLTRVGIEFATDYFAVDQTITTIPVNLQEELMKGFELIMIINNLNQGLRLDQTLLPNYETFRRELVGA